MWNRVIVWSKRGEWIQDLSEGGMGGWEGWTRFPWHTLTTRKLIKMKLLWPKISYTCSHKIGHTRRAKAEYICILFIWTKKISKKILQGIIRCMILVFLLWKHVVSPFDRNEPKEQSQDTMHLKLLKDTTKGTTVYYSLLFCSFFIYLISLLCFLMSSLLVDCGQNLPKSVAGGWSTITDIIYPKQIITLWIISRPLLAPAESRLCSPCQIESRKHVHITNHYTFAIYTGLWRDDYL